MKKVTNITFILVLFIIMFGGLVKPIVNEEKDNYYENRPAYLMPDFTIESLINKTYQDEFEKALSDQLPLATRMKQVQKNLGTLTKIMYSLSSKDSFVNLEGILLKDNYLLYQSTNINDIKQNIDAKIDNINLAVKENKKTEFYLYYIEKDTDIDFITNEKSNIYQYMDEKLASKINKDVFEINNFTDYKNYFYKTDHHWNHKGSYKAYLELCEMFSLKPLLYEKELDLGQTWSGSKARQIGGDLLFRERFKAYRFNFEEHKTYINNIEVPEYGNTKSCFEGETEGISYGYFYGDDNGLVEFDYNDNKKENLLIVGESYDNAINELLASHFNKTYNVDLRAYESDIGKKFELKRFLKEKNIDKVLLIGNRDFYTLETFNLIN